MSMPNYLTDQHLQYTHEGKCQYCDDNHAVTGTEMRQVYDVYQNLGAIVVGGIHAKTSIVRLRTDCREMAEQTLNIHKPGFIHQFEMSMTD